MERETEEQKNENSGRCVSMFYSLLFSIVFMLVQSGCFTHADCIEKYYYYFFSSSFQIVVHELHMVQRQHHQKIEMMQSSHGLETISEETKLVIKEHCERVNDVFLHHGVDAETCTLLRQLHSHHNDVMYRLLVKQKSLEEGHAFVAAAPAGTLC